MIEIYGLVNKHIVVTGASSGIGRETAVLLSRYGARVSLVARREEALRETLSLMEGDGHHYYCCDLSQTDEISGLVSTIVTDSGPADGFIHCAGIGANLPISLTRTDTIDSLMRTNFYSFAEFIRLLSKKKNSNSGASYVGVSSVASIKGDKSQGAYAATKAAMNAYVHPAAKELAAKDIRVNTVAFGVIRTEAYRKFLEDGGQDSALQNQFLGYGEPSDAANLLVFLVSKASRLITGTTIICDGGYTS
ncbi:MAG: SDR family oxidoreductase [Lachnospiraceae bacterium]|nr:SDR family oxidoreductase [Lachnospiraceae bacterium]